MGNLFTSNEPTLNDKLREQLCRIVLEYEKLELVCGYIAIFEMSVASQRTALSTTMSHGSTSPDLLSPFPNHSNSSSFYGGHQSREQTGVNHDMDEQQYHNADKSFNDQHQHHHTSSTRSNLKVKEKKEIQKIIDLDYKQFYEWKIEEIMKSNPNITEHELKENHGLILITSSNNIFTRPLISIFQDDRDEKENLLQTETRRETEIQIHDASSTNNIHDIKHIVQNNDIKSSVQSLGDTTEQLLQILDRAKILHKMRHTRSDKIIHIRGNKQTIFSYYLILNRYIIISYAQSKSECLGFLEWIKIQSKLEKLEITLKDIELLLSLETKKT